MLQSMGWQTVGPDSGTEQQQCVVLCYDNPRKLIQNSPCPYLVDTSEF